MPRSRWRRVVAVLGFLVFVWIWATCLYSVLEGRVIDGRVLSCGAGPRRSCDVAWSYGSAHGISNVESDGASPGGLESLYYTPGLGITPRVSAIAFTVFLPVAACVCIGVVLWKRRSAVY